MGRLSVQGATVYSEMRTCPALEGFRWPCKLEPGSSGTDPSAFQFLGLSLALARGMGLGDGRGRDA